MWVDYVKYGAIGWPEEVELSSRPQYARFSNEASLIANKAHDVTSSYSSFSPRDTGTGGWIQTDPSDAPRHKVFSVR